MDHHQLIEEMPHIEQMPTQERLILARKRRNHQLKQWLQKEKEHERKVGKQKKSNRKGIVFDDSVVLLEAAARNDIDEVRRLLMRGVSPDSCNEDGLTALHQCCIDDNEAMLLLLLEYGANVNAEDSEKWTPLHAAATCGHIKLVRILISRGANLLAVNADGNMPYDICEDEQALDYIESEMAKRGVTQQLIDETRAATERKMLADMRIMAARSESLEQYDSQGATPLHIAAANGYLSVIEFLLDQGVRTDVTDKDDWQPSHAAACWGHIEVLEMLTYAGANLNAKNRNDETPADICEDPEIKERILELQTEQEIKRQAEAKRKVRRSQSNTRTQSVRRTSLRDKGLTARRDAVEEARFRLLAGTSNIDTNDNNVSTSANKSAAVPPSVPNNNNNVDYNSTVSFIKGDTSSIASDIPDNALVLRTADSHRRDPEGKDNDSMLENHVMETKEKTYTTDVNGKVTVHVVVTINGNGTLADLKKQRMQIRNSTNDVNNLGTPLICIFYQGFGDQHVYQSEVLKQQEYSSALEKVINTTLNAAFKILPDPIHYDNVHLGSTVKSPLIGGSADITDITISGQRSLVATSINLNSRTMIAEITLVLQELRITSNYRSLARLLTLPVWGRGNSSVTLKNLNINLLGKANFDIRNGFYLSESTLAYEIEDFKVDINGLYNSKLISKLTSKILSRVSLKIINSELIQDVLNEFIASLLEGILRNVAFANEAVGLEDVPFNDIDNNIVPI
ncbi:protein phosphatase 1 regulatory subunit 16A [Cylas formicarius]|uniref:protein phosphatase 1 regulatory subunit 16A n=1 Tax=Cylas formicarius TaxID=197179 RepID=UPI0029585D61|nr:protein phosphatase 1 regulatory subunit 16A [Cylas formicarius]XP_060535158.1 protein phosphatase 1 regulatory subunit 16A [Cylas formicarius]